MTEIFPPANPTRFLEDQRYHNMRKEQAWAFITGDTEGYAPQDPRAIMLELLTFIEEVKER